MCLIFGQISYLGYGTLSCCLGKFKDPSINSHLWKLNLCKHSPSVLLFFVYTHAHFPFLHLFPRPNTDTKRFASTVF